MAESNSRSSSVTLRIPNEVLEIIDSKAELLGGKGKRSEVIVNLLKTSLGQPIPGITTVLEKNEKLEQEIFVIKKKVSEIEDILEVVRQRFTQYDNDIEFLRNSLNNSFKEKLLIDDKLESLTNAETDSYTPLVNQSLKETFAESSEFDSKQLSLELSILSSNSLDTIEASEETDINNLQMIPDINGQPIVFSLELLATRLQIKSETLRTSFSKYKNIPGKLGQWTSDKDPDNIPWKYVKHLKGYIPDIDITDNQRAELIKLLPEKSLPILEINNEELGLTNIEIDKLELSTKSNQILLSGKKLAERLKVSPSVITSHKKSNTPESFLDWSRQRDPENLGWQYESELHQYASVL